MSVSFRYFFKIQRSLIIKIAILQLIPIIDIIYNITRESRHVENPVVRELFKNEVARFNAPKILPYSDN